MPARTQHGEKRISDRGKAFGIEAKTINGNDPEVSYRELKKAMEYVRTERKPFLLEAMVSRLYGHSSSSGANFIKVEEIDPLAEVEKTLEQRGILTRSHMDSLREKQHLSFLLEGIEAGARPSRSPTGRAPHPRLRRAAGP